MKWHVMGLTMLIILQNNMLELGDWVCTDVMSNNLFIFEVPSDFCFVKLSLFCVYILKPMNIPKYNVGLCESAT